ncbi:ComEA family DNA-binding protein [Streptomyces sp. NPDC028635]|uniref:ComEA family DNA-binding protein n=1 Tax=Streptomyces sp. NPDC028635 TaxID=3154800 RepID=UPI0033D18306
MALRERTRPPHATSGPGRGPASDGRLRDRRPGGRARRHHKRQAPAEELRRRARIVFAQRAGAGPESGAAPPTPGVARSPDAQPAHQAQAEPATPEQRDGRRWSGIGPALRERMPVWVQTRCGLERRSVLALGVLLAVAAVLAVQHFWTGRTETVSAPEVVRAAAPRTAEPAAPDIRAAPPRPAATAGPEIVVDVSGKVRRPGIHRLPAGSRVVDALSAAGGVRPGTDTQGLNRARFLIDGEQVVVGGPQPAAGPGTSGAGTWPGGGGGSAGAVGGGAPAGPVSLNTATVDQLDALPGVGPVLARHIVDYRTQHGGFRSVDELREVNGIGDRRFSDLRELVRP